MLRGLTRRVAPGTDDTNRRSYSAGEWGQNQVRVFPDPMTGLIQIEWREDGRRHSRSLRHPRLGSGKEAGGVSARNPQLGPKSRDEKGKVARQVQPPFRGLKIPKEKNPTRVGLTQREYEAVSRELAGAI